VIEASTDDDHDDHSDEDDYGDLVVLSEAELDEFDIEVRTAGPGMMAVERELPGEVRANEDRYAHVTPRVAGVVRSVNATVGGYVRAGQTVAVIESRELADLKADYLAAIERQELALSSFAREERLYNQEITSEADYLEARQVLAEARIRIRSARQKLIALGFSDAYIASLPEENERSLVAYPLTAPISGRIVEKHIVSGEAVQGDTEAFEVADLSSVWVDLSVYQRDLGIVREGQTVVVDAGPGQPRTRGTITYVRPVVGEETRTAIARAVLQNPEGMLRPGQFVSGRIAVDEARVAVMVPASAVLDVEGTPSVFVETSEGFEPRAVVVGERAGDQVSITEGLEAGERYVARGGFALKAELGKSEMDDGHAH
jgi:cobalt-zinc-cadmium efflux system membrane fusion protein